ncbi:HD domain-containing protein [Allorhizobium sp. BGMRC 0089]|uniref:HD domain-containing protein n=1 Tax=Allorhizobium sonneratiae TaxID=2934936 RepID=UPI00203424D1|nr:HD domain-containing protein [Allorhizobium sonneratiae]MCM2291989.1 HD domain-containing protein [Allorhizobium sonneratiae]
MADLFAPFERLANWLLPYALEQQDGAHDDSHLVRVFNNAMRIHAQEGGDGEILAAAVLLHDCVHVEKNAPHRAQASRLAADKASRLLNEAHWPDIRIEAVAHAIVSHSFSANQPPQSLEAKILQDADRLDALGFIGLARTFAIAGRLGGQLYDHLDPCAERRPLDDRRYALDHFATKLFKLADGFQTATGKAMARQRHERLQLFHAMFLEETTGAKPESNFYLSF